MSRPGTGDAWARGSEPAWLDEARAWPGHDLIARVEDGAAGDPAADRPGEPGHGGGDDAHWATVGETGEPTVFALGQRTPGHMLPAVRRFQIAARLRVPHGADIDAAADPSVYKVAVRWPALMARDTARFAAANAAGRGLPSRQPAARRSGLLAAAAAGVEAARGRAGARRIVAADQPFRVGGGDRRYPRDPDGPARETINCGRVSLPCMDDWTVAGPGELHRPRTAAESAEARHRGGVFRPGPGGADRLRPAGRCGVGRPVTTIWPLASR